VDAWVAVIGANWDRLLAMDRAVVATGMRERTQAPTVGRAYDAILRSVIAGHK
jgi:hypothetical protein